MLFLLKLYKNWIQTSRTVYFKFSKLGLTSKASFGLILIYSNFPIRFRNKRQILDIMNNGNQDSEFHNAVFLICNVSFPKIFFTEMS